ncbi:MAG TPA: DUF5658 family protein [Phycisphaerales bacterium]|nr:DUF5658 family protein [Phycisphaerales bacterium]
MDGSDTIALAAGNGCSVIRRPRRLFGPPPTNATPGERRRAIRVCLLVATIAILSMSDLYMTLTHLRGVGMGEANPLARLVISYNSPMLLSVWKCACVFLACVILVMARHRWSGEAASWVCAAVLTALTVHWATYCTEAATLTSQISTMQADPPSNWVSMGGD